MSAEKLAGVPFLLRRHDDKKRYGDKWLYSLTVEIEEDIAHVKGLKSDEFKRDDFELILEMCKRLGAKKVIYERLKNGQFIKKTVMI